MRCISVLSLVTGTLAVLLTSHPATAQESAVPAAREQVAKAPGRPEARLALGRALRRAGREADALTELRRGLALGGKPALAQALTWEIARTHIDRRDFASAAKTCRDLGKLPAATAASRVCAAEAHLLWRRATEAIAELDKVGRTTPLAPEVAYAAKVALGRARELEGKELEAEQAYRAAIALEPAQADAHVALGVLLRRTGKDGAVDALKRAVETDPADPEAQLELARALPAGSPEAIAAYERSLASRPENADALRAVAEAYVLAKRTPDAKRAAEAALKLAPNDVASQVLSGRIALGEGKPDEAIRAGELASERMKNFAPAKLLVADANAKKGEIDLAIEAYQAAIGLDKSDPTPLVRATEACLAAGRTTSAKAFAERATRDFPTSGAAWEALGDALSADEESAAAERAYATAKTKGSVDVASIDRKIARLR